MSAVIEAAGRSLEVSKPEKVLFPDDGITKEDLAAYYRDLGERIVPHVKERAVTMHRFPDGIDDGDFYQKEIPDYFPDWIDRKTLPKEDGEVTYLIANDVATLVYLADQAVITPHVTLSRVDRPDHPDQMIFDMDPPEDSDDIEMVRKSTEKVYEVLADLELNAFLKTTGSKGYHIVVPLDRSASFDQVREFARDVARVAAGRYAELLTVAHRKAKRGGRVFVDYLRNSYGQTAVAPYAVRALPGAPVAAPVDWDELSETAPRDYTMANVRRRLSQRDDPWGGVRWETGAGSLRRPRPARRNDLIYQGGRMTVDTEIELPDGTTLGAFIEGEPDVGTVIFAHGSGSSRHSRRNQHVASLLQDAGMETVLIDLLTEAEEKVDVRTREHRFDIDLLAGRVAGAIDWWRSANPDSPEGSVGLFGASTGAAAALMAATQRPNEVGAVVSRGGRPDLATNALESVESPTLLVVGGRDEQVIELNESAQSRLKAENKLEIVPGASHLFEEPGALDQVAELAAKWFTEYLSPEG